MVTTTLTDLITAMKANEQDKNAALGDLDLEALRIASCDTMPEAESGNYLFGTHATKRRSYHKRKPTKQEDAPIKPTKFGLSARSFGRSRNDISAEHIQPPCKSCGETE